MLLSFYSAYLFLLSFVNNLVPGSLVWRARNVMMGSVLGAAVCFPLGKSFQPRAIRMPLFFPIDFCEPN